MACSFASRHFLRLTSFIFLLTTACLPAAHAQSFGDKAKKALIEAVTAKVGEAVGVGAPLQLDHKTAFHAADLPVDFHPVVLHPSSSYSLNKPLAPGDYMLPVIGYCTALGVPSPGNGLGQKIARLQGKDAGTVARLLDRGTRHGIPVHTLQTMVWRIEDGLPVDKWPDEDQKIVERLIPEHKKSINGDYVESIQKNYSRTAKFLGLPPFETLLSNMGEPGKKMLMLKAAREILANKAISNERQPQLLFEQAGTPVQPSSTVEATSEWSEIRPGVIARFLTVGGADSENKLEFRILPTAVRTAKVAEIRAPVSGFRLAGYAQQEQTTASPVQYYPTIQSILTGSELVAGEIITVAGETFVVAAETAAAVELLPVEAAVGTAYIVYSIGQHATQPLILMAKMDGDGKGEGGRKQGKQGKIKYDEDSLDHVKDRHTPGGKDNGRASTFNPDENLPDLIDKAEDTPPTPQSKGNNVERIVDAGRPIGTDRATGQPTNIYTVVTDKSGNLVTMFPGAPSW